MSSRLRTSSVLSLSKISGPERSLEVSLVASLVVGIVELESNENCIYIFYGNKIFVCFKLRIPFVPKYFVIFSYCFTMKCYPAHLYKGSIAIGVVSADCRYDTHSLLLMPKVYFMFLIFLILEPLYHRKRSQVAVNDRGTKSYDKGASIKTRS